MKPSKSERQERVDKFKDGCLKAGFREVAPHVYELPGPSPKKVTISTLVHGNEIGGMEVFQKIIKEIHSGNLKPRSQLRFILGNVEAYFEDKRFIETDMNRSVGLTEPETREELRAREIGNFLEDSDVILDIHQTIGPTDTPFFIFELHRPSYNFARLLHPTIPVVTYSKKRDFKGKTSTAFAIDKGRIAVTIETGQKAIDEGQISLGLDIARRTIEMNFEKVLPDSPYTHTFTFSQTVSNYDRSLEMVKVYRNFESVRKGELLAKNSLTEVYSEVDGVVLFAKYGDYAKTSSELALILKAVHEEDEIKKENL